MPSFEESQRRVVDVLSDLHQVSLTTGQWRNQPGQPPMISSQSPQTGADSAEARRISDLCDQMREIILSDRSDSPCIKTHADTFATLYTSLDITMQKALEQRLAEVSLRTIHDVAQEITGEEDRPIAINSSSDPAFARAKKMIRSLATYLALTHEYLKHSDKEGPLAILFKNIDHDIGNILAASAVRIRAIERDLNVCDAGLNHKLTLIRDLIDANHAVVTGVFARKECELTTSLTPLLSILRERFDCGCEEDEEATSQGALRTITVNSELTESWPLSGPVLRLMLYNLIKNSMAAHQASGSTVPFSVSLDLKSTTINDEPFLLISVEDNGIPFNYENLADFFSARAASKQVAGIPLLTVEHCLLDEYWREHVPQIALTSLLADRGVSMSGGTGIGLALCRMIVEDGHNGRMVFTKGDSNGVCVKIFIPRTVPSCDPLLETLARRAPKATRSTNA